MSSNRVLVCFFPDFVAVGLAFASLPALPAFCLCSALGRGPAPHYRSKVEGRPDVRIGVRDTIVHIDISRPRIGTVVRITTTQHQTEARTPSTEARQPYSGCKGTIFFRLSDINHIKTWKKVKDRYIKKPLRGYSEGVA